jgi:hypothetical protein
MEWGLINLTQEKFYPALATHYLDTEMRGMEAKLHLFVSFGSNVVGCVAFLFISGRTRDQISVRREVIVGLSAGLLSHSKQVTG